MQRILIVALTATAAGQALAGTGWSFDVRTDQPFEPGHSCAELAYLDEAELKEALSPTFASDFNAFCRPEEPTSCSDYTSALKGQGTMADGEDGFYCKFVPAKTKIENKKP